MEIDNFQEPTDQFNDEASMAKADLYKLGKYSVKLIKQIHDGQDLEAWIQAKITKAADYIASVYHYMEYEMKVSEYGDKLESADMYEEHLKDKLKSKLMEAKASLKKVAKKESAKMKSSPCNEDCSTKPSAGMSKKQKSAVVSKAKKGEDIGKPGKGFKEVEKSAKKSGASNPTAVAAAALWKQQAKKAKKG